MDFDTAEQDGGVPHALDRRFGQFARRKLIVRQSGSHVPLEGLQRIGGGRAAPVQRETGPPHFGQAGHGGTLESRQVLDRVQCAQRPGGRGFPYTGF